MDLVSRLKEYISHLQMPVTQFADTANIPRPTFSQLLNGRNKKVSDELIGKIHTAFPELNILWLLFGENEMLEKNSNLSSLNYPKKPVSSQGTPADTYRNTAVNQTSERLDTYNHPSETIEFGERFSSDRKSNETDRKSFETPEFDFDELQPSSSAAEPNPVEEVQELPSDTIGISFDNDSTTPHNNNCSNPDRKIVNIIVYYSDNSFESFTPDAAGKFIAPLTNYRTSDK